jgi:NAD(P)-dependent dehydrogenase (short-subunit alcohol dehydrogenase family)
MRLANKIIIITGSGSGIGRASALLFAKEGATVVVNDLNVENGTETVTQIETAGGSAIFIKADVTEPEEVKALVDQVIIQYGRVDVLFNNAGISNVGALHEVEPEAWDRVMRVNTRGVFLPSKYVLPHMMERKAGSIINMSSCVAEI